MRERICVIGGGIAGVTSALELAARGFAVDLLEAGTRLFDGVSTRQSHREHLGHHYPGDPGGGTARMCMRGALAFERRFPGFTSCERPWFNFVVRGRDDAAAPSWERSSIVTAAEYLAYCDTLSALYEQLLAEEEGVPFGTADGFCRVLAPAEYAHLVAAERVALGVASPERVVMTRRFVAHLAALVRCHPAVSVHLDHRVLEAEPSGGGYRLAVRRPGGACALQYQQVVNATWSRAPLLDEQVGAPAPPSTIRLRFITHVDLPAELAEQPSLFFTLGAFGNYTNLGRTSRSAAEGALFYVPVCDAGSTAERDIPDDWKMLISLGLAPARAREIGHEVIRGMARFVPAMARARLRETRVGTVITPGDADIWDRDSAMHRRSEAGVVAVAPGWHSVNVAKLTYCVWVAGEVADAVLAQAGRAPAAAARVARGGRANILGIQRVRVIVKDRRASRAFLEDFLGLEPRGRSDEGCYQAGPGGPIVEIAEDAELVVDPERGGYLYRHIGFEIASLRAAIAHGLRLGLRLFLIAPDGGEKVIESPDDDLSFSLERVVFVRDQDHNLWELVERGLSLPTLFHT